MVDDSTFDVYDITDFRSQYCGLHDIMFHLPRLLKVLKNDFGEKEEEVTYKNLIRSNKFYYKDRYTEPYIEELNPYRISLNDLCFTKYDNYDMVLYYNSS